MKYFLPWLADEQYWNAVKDISELLKATKSQKTFLPSSMQVSVLWLFLSFPVVTGGDVGDSPHLQSALALQTRSLCISKQSW